MFKWIVICVVFAGLFSGWHNSFADSAQVRPLSDEDKTWKELRDQADSLSDEYMLDSAIIIGNQALEKAEAELGSEDMEIVWMLYNIGKYHYQKAEYESAEKLWNDALKVVEKNLGPDHPDIAKIINGLAAICVDQIRYDEAEPLHLRALAIREKAFGRDHNDVAISLNGLAILYGDQGDYARAEPLQRRALAIFEKTRGPEDWRVAAGLVNLAALLSDQGKYDEALTMLGRALVITEKILGPDHPRVAQVLNNMGSISEILDKFNDAEAYIERALAIYETAFGKEHPHWAITLNNLASIYVGQGKYAEAEPLCLRALAAHEKNLGRKHLYNADPLHLVALLYMKQGRYDEAEPVLERELAIRMDGLGPSHPLTASTLTSFSKFHRMQKDTDRALQMAAQAADIRQKNFKNNASVLTEKEALVFSQFWRGAVDDYLSCYFQMDKPINDIIGKAANIILSSKGPVSDGIFQRRKSLVRETDSTTVALAHSLRFVKTRLAGLFVEGPGEDAEVYRDEIDSLTALVNDLEADLSRRSDSYRKRQDLANIDADRLASLLPENTVLVEYVKYNYISDRSDTTIPRYLAVLVAGKQKMAIVDLGEAIAIDTLIDQCRQHMLSVSSSGQAPTIIDLHDYNNISKALYEEVWKPLVVHISGKTRVFIAPDGALNVISFAGLIDADGKYLIESHSLHYLSAARDLIRLKEEVELASGLFALGDPNFDAPAVSRISAPEGKPLDLLQEPATHVVRNVRSGCGELNKIRVSPLPGTRREIEVIAAGWDESTQGSIGIYTGARASEEKFKTEAPGNRIIHLASHGFFLEGTCQPHIPKIVFDMEEGYIAENPLLLSGLFLAGANLHGQGADSLGAEDGILTAYEVSAMDFEGTELVVLSACETGLGEIQQGEGVYGLRRAFQMAGARTVISALWPVSDKATAEMMGRLYDRGEETLPERMRRIQLEKIDELRAKNEVDHPYSWGAFIALGDWR